MADLLAKGAGPHAQDVGEPPGLALAPRRAGGQPVGHHLNCERRPILDHNRPVAVDDLPPRRLDLHRAHPVVVGLREIAVARQDLQVPEPEEDDPEEDERDATEDRDAKRERRRDDHPLVAPR